MSNAVNDKSGELPALCAVADALPNATLIIDRRGVIAVANTLVNKLINFSDDRPLEGQSYWSVLPEGLRDIVAAMQREVLIYACDARRDFELQRSGQSNCLLDVHLSPVSSAGDQPSHFCLSLVEASARQEVAELKRMDKMKSNFLSMISHELRTPLTSIRGAVHLLSESETCQAAEGMNALVEIVRGNSERLIRLVNNLLEMVAIDNSTFSISRAPVSPGSLVRQVLDRYRDAARSKFVVMSFDEGTGVGLLDADRFKQLVGYLVDNALKFTPPGGRVSVSLSQLPSGPLQLKVSDTGGGVPAYARDCIFDRFYQVEDSMTRCCGGAGVGLYLARHIMQVHGGQIWMDPNSDGGSDFIAIFPGVPASLEAESESTKTQQI